MFVCYRYCIVFLFTVIICSSAAITFTFRSLRGTFVISKYLQSHGDRLRCLTQLELNIILKFFYRLCVTVPRLCDIRENTYGAHLSLNSASSSGIWLQHRARLPIKFNWIFEKKAWADVNRIISVFSKLLQNTLSFLYNQNCYKYRISSTHVTLCYIMLSVAWKWFQFLYVLQSMLCAV